MNSTRRIMFELTDYDYILPQELIAQSAAHPADSCKFLVYDKKTSSRTDDIFSSLPSKISS